MLNPAVRKVIAFLFMLVAYIVLPIVTFYQLMMYNQVASLYEFYDLQGLERTVTIIVSMFLYYFMVTQLIIGQRWPILDKIWGHPRLMYLHGRVLSFVLMFLLLAHIVLHYFAQDLGFPWGVQIILAVIAVAIGIFLVLTAFFAWFDKTTKRSSYTAMHNLHHLFYLVAFIIVIHVLLSGSYEGNTIGWYMIMGYFVLAVLPKIINTIIGKVNKHEMTVLSVTQLNHNLCQVMFTPNKPNKFKPKPGQYVYIRYRGKMVPKLLREEHPFSLSAFGAEENSKAVYSFTAKASGDFTQEHYKQASPEFGLRVYGPYGRFNALEYKYSNNILIAGGIGITPFLSMLDAVALSADAKQKKWHLHWFIRSQEDMVYTERFDNYKKNIPHVNITLHVATPLEAQASIIAEALAAEVTQHAARECGLFICGPAAMLPSVLTAAKNNGIPKGHVHHEFFGL